MKTLATFSVLAVLAAGTAVADETKPLRFEVSVEAGKPGVLSGPEVKDISNAAVRIGYQPTNEFQLTLTYTKWKGKFSRNDSIATNFAQEFNRGRSSSQQVNFRDSVFDERDVEFKQMELGVVKSIPSSNHWEAYVGLGLGVQNSKANVSWTGPHIAPGTNTDFEIKKTNEFMTTIRGGVRYAFVRWFAVQANLKWIPIAKMFEQDYNGVELNGALVFRFGSF